MLSLYLVSIVLIIVIFENPLIQSSLIFGKRANFILNGLGASDNGTIRAIEICCSWNKNLAFENVSYSIINANNSLKQAIEKGLKEWSKSDAIRFVEVPDSNNADIRIRFIPNESAVPLRNNTNNRLIMQSGLMVGKTIDTFDNNGHIASANILIYGSAFGNSLDAQTLQNVAAHEIGHALGLGHASFDTDLMFNKVRYDNEFVSQCDINGVLKANEGKFKYILDDPSKAGPRIFEC